MTIRPDQGSITYRNNVRQALGPSLAFLRDFFCISSGIHFISSPAVDQGVGTFFGRSMNYTSYASIQRHAEGGRRYYLRTSMLDIVNLDLNSR